MNINRKDLSLQRRVDKDMTETDPLLSKADQGVVDCGKRNRPGNVVTIMEIILQMMAIANSNINMDGQPNID